MAKFSGAKIITVISVIISIVCIGASMALFTIAKSDRADKIRFQDKLVEVEKAKKQLSREIEELKLIKDDLEIKLSGLESQTKLLAEKYEKEKSQNDVTRDKLSKKEKEHNDIKARLDSVIREKEDIQMLLDGKTAKYNQLKERVDKLVEVKNALEGKVKNIIEKQGIELERIVVKVEGGLEGKVLVVNRDYNFIVADIGTSEDINLSDILTIFRNGKYVGEAQVEKIYATMSAATIIKETKAGTIRVNDKVILRNN